VPGLTLISLSLLLFSMLDQGSDFWNVLPALIVGGLGMAMAMAPTTAAAMGSVPVDKAGVGSAVINSMRQVGGAVGLALAGAIVATKFDPANPRPDQFVEGFQLGLRVAAGIAATGILVAAFGIGKVRHLEAHEATPEAA
jgi:MFS family permease